MSRWSADPEAAADALLENTIDDLNFTGRLLLANQHGRMPQVLKQRGLDAAEQLARQRARLASKELARHGTRADQSVGGRARLAAN